MRAIASWWSDEGRLLVGGVLRGDRWWWSDEGRSFWWDLCGDRWWKECEERLQ